MFYIPEGGQGLVLGRAGGTQLWQPCRGEIAKH